MGPGAGAVTIAAGARELRRPAPPASGGPRFAAFCSTYVRQTKGRWANHALELEGWERAFWNEALEIDPATGRRIYQEAGLGVPTKNGKSTQASAAGLYFLVADGEAEPEVIVAAAAAPQARVVFGQSRTMAQASPLLLDHLRVLKYSLEVPRTGGIMRAVAADAALQHGGNPSANIIDEIHAHKSADLYTALTKSGAARDQPFTLWITTEGGDGAGLLAELKGQMFTGAGELERRPGLLIYRDRGNGILVYWYGAEADADIEDPATWALVNPASWMTDGRWLRSQFERLKARNALPEWQMYHLNMTPDRLQRAVDLAAFKAATRRELALRPELPVGVGVYRSADGTQGAVVVAQRQPDVRDGQPGVVVRAYHFPPDATGQAPALAIRAKLVELRATYPAPQAIDKKYHAPILGPAIAWCSNYLAETAETLTAEGLNMVKFPLYAATMGPASTLASELIATGRLAHDGDLVLIDHVNRTDATINARGRLWVAAAPPDHNPSAIALPPAIAMAMQGAPVPAAAPVYGSFGLP